MNAMKASIEEIKMGMHSFKLMFSFFYCPELYLFHKCLLQLQMEIEMFNRCQNSQSPQSLPQKLTQADEIVRSVFSYGNSGFFITKKY